MFKLESYITPLLLSYVNKYIKNLKPEDSQVSLWGGDAVFNNLDLRLDVLEQELKLPFIFVNGHIHELRIHVPWTKLGSESVVITINTIECIVKLHDAADDNSSTKSSAGSIKVRGEGKRSAKNAAEVEAVAPPSYVQNLLNRVVNNITVVCNNVILKYVEEDIVLSLNVKSLRASSANEKWEPAFVDVSLSMPILRKLVHLHDLTVCLDSMNSSGKIDTYQDPLMYHCSLDCRLYMAFDNLSCKKVAISRANILCQELDFSITDKQLPMFVRLLDLCLALYYNEISNSSNTVANTDTGVSDNNTENELKVLNEEDEGWSSWMWSYVWPGDEDNPQEAALLEKNAAILHVGLYIERFMFTFKVANVSEKNVHLSSARFSFTPVAKLYLEGVFLDMKLRGDDFVNVQMGMDQVRITSVGDCVCCVWHEIDTNLESCNSPLEIQEKTFFKIGLANSNKTRFIKDSLFDSSAPENQGQHRQYFFDWDTHFAKLPDSKLLDRADAIAFDYFYVIDLPNDWTEKSSGVSVSDLEYSNLHERTEARVWVGPMEFDLNNDVVHRVQWLIRAAQQHEYTPYSMSKNEPVEESYSPPTEEEIRSLETFIPFKTFNLSFIRPVITVHLPEHQKLDFTQPRVLKKMKKVKSRSRNGSKVQKKQTVQSHCIVIYAEFIDVKFTLPKYPRRVVKTTSLLSTPSLLLLHHCYSYTTIKVMGCAADMKSLRVGSPTSTCSLLQPCNVVLHQKSVLCPNLWQNNDEVENETSVQVDCVHLRAGIGDIWVAVQVPLMWMRANDAGNNGSYSPTSHNFTNINPEIKGKSLLELIITDASLKTSYTDKHTAFTVLIGILSLNRVREGGHLIPILNGPENHILTAEELQKFNSSTALDSQDKSDKLLVFTVQYSKNSAFNTEVHAVVASTMEKIAIVCAVDTIEWLADETSKVINHFPDNTCAEVDASCESFSKEDTDPSSQIISNTESYFKGQSSSTGIPKTPNVDALKTADYFAMSQSHCWLSICKNLVVQMRIKGCSVIVPYGNFSAESKWTGIWKSVHQQYTSGCLQDTVIINCPQIKLMTSSKQDTALVGHAVPMRKIGNWSLSEGVPWIFNMERFSIYSIHGERVVISLIREWQASATIALNSAPKPKPEKDTKQLNLCVHVDLQQMHMHCSHLQVQLVSKLASNIANSIHRLREITLPLANGRDYNSVKPVNTAIIESGTAAATTGLSNETGTVCLWMQITIPRFVLEFVGTASEQELRVTFEMEDVSSSIDVQDIYSKINLKISTFNATHYVRQDGEWKVGPYKGVTLCCRERLTKLLFIPNAENDYVELMSNSGSLDEQTSELPDTASNHFFNLTLTSAQSRNAHKRWLKMMDKCESGGVTGRLKLQPQARSSVRYISEVDVKVMPFDCVVWPPVIHCIESVLDPMLMAWTSAVYTFSSGRAPIESGATGYAKWQSLGTNLPLLYASCRSIRIFLPADAKEERFRQSLWSRCEDVAVMALGSIQINSQVENPLPRTLLEQDIYDAAHQAGILGIPGSDVEDRQYQMDVATISLSTGVWHDIAFSDGQYSPAHDVMGNLKTMGENPAFKWNTISSSDDGSSGRCMTVLSPLLLPFDVRVAFAPAIICHGLDSPEKGGILVAGHSLEVNVSTDVVINANISQMPLLLGIVSGLQLPHSNGQTTECPILVQHALRADVPEASTAAAVNRPKDKSSFWTEPRDSGVGSEGSTFPLPTVSGADTNAVLQPGWLKSPNYGPGGVKNAEDLPLPCFEIFVTARRVAVSVFVILRDGTFATENAKCDGTMLDNEMSKGPLVHPLVHSIISQPHLFLHCYRQNQKLELCCYDVSVRGSPEKVVLSDDCYIPRIEDFPVSWIDTRHGKPNMKTGIPPALATVTLTDFCNPGIILKLERPIKLQLSSCILSNVKFVEEILESANLWSFFNPDHELNELNELNEPNESQVLKFRKIIAKMSKVDISTSQMLFEFIPIIGERANDRWVMSFEEVSGTFTFKGSLESKDLASSMSGKITAEGFCVMMMLEDTKKSLLKHSSVVLQMNAVWDSWCLNSDLPRVILKLETGALFVHFDKDIIKSLTELCKSFSNTDPPDMEIKDEVNSSGKVPKVEDNLSQTWHDDLRVGVFQYIQGLDDGDDNPEPYEIVFCKHKVGNMASMSWRYPQPRAITRVEINPVPFCTPADDDTNDIIYCVLQYWEPLRADYISYRKFFLSETANCTLDMPSVTCDTYKDLVIAHTWRVVMDFSCDDTERKAPFVSPLALAACLRVDSYFNPVLVASFEVLTTVELLYVTVGLQVNAGKKSHWHQLENFTADDVAAVDQEIMFLNFENIRLGFDNWHAWQKINTSLNLRLEILEYRCLTKKVLAENFSVELQAIVSKNNYLQSTRKQNVEVTMDTSEITVYVSQSAVHTLSLASVEWKRDKDDDHIVILNYYVVCNDTDETIRFGQENTEESIVLHCGQMHMYSWLSPSKTKKLRLSSKSTEWKWCDPFFIDREESFVRNVASQDRNVTVNISVKCLSNTQKQILVSGQLSVVNRLNHRLDIVLNFPNNAKEPESKETTKNLHVERMSAGRSVIMEQSLVPSIRASINGDSLLWSQDIDIGICLNTGKNDSILIQFPSADGLQLQEAWCNIIVHSEGQCTHLLVAFTPMYTVTVHFPFPLIMITRSKNDEELHRVCIKGRGHEHHIEVTGNNSIDRTLCFQLNKNVEASRPAIVLSSSLLSQMEKNANVGDFLSLCSTDERNSQYLWPYLDDDLEEFLAEHEEYSKIPSLLKSIAEMKVVNVDEPVNLLDQPRVDLEVFLTQRWPGCNTVAIDIKPWGLLVNRTGIDLIFQYGTDEWLIAVGSAFSPPKLQESFKLAVYYYNQWHYSDSIELDHSDSSFHRYQPKVKGILRKGDCMQCNIKVALASKVCLLSVQYKYKNGMTVLLVKPSYFVINNCSSSLVFRPLVALCDPEFGSALHIPETTDANEIFEECNVGKVCAILLWNLVTSVESQSIFADTLCFLCVGLQKNCIGHSLPCKLQSADQTTAKPTVYQAVVPLVNETDVDKEMEEDAFCSLPLRLICCPYVGSCFISVNDDIAPQFQIYNNCNFELYFGQGVEGIGGTFTVHEEMGLLQNIPYLPPHSSRHYTFPWLLETFPNIPRTQLPLLHLSGKCYDDRLACPANIWSNGVSVSSEHELFVNIPTISDVKVRTLRQSAVMNIYIDPVSRVEVSAKEIRSRLKSKSPSEHQYTARKKGEDEGSKLKSAKQTQVPADGHSVDAVRRKRRDAVVADERLYDMYIASCVAQVCVVLVDEACRKGSCQEICPKGSCPKGYCPKGCREVLRLSASNLRFMYRPLSNGHDSERKTRSRGQSMKEQMVICVGALQVDNQLQFTNKYHFPVIVVQQNANGTETDGDKLMVDSWKGSSNTVTWQTAMTNSMLVVNIISILDREDGQRYLEDVVINLKPVAAYVEDTLLYELIDIVPTYLPVFPLTKSVLHPWTGLVPMKVQMEVTPMRFPVMIQRLRVEPINVLLSAHASMKLFLSLDSTPLNFKAFECNSLQTTGYHLGQVVTTHYLSGALIRAGWVIGSLDLLANPGGLVRAVGTGISDLVKMPYYGLMQGPFAFLAGCLFGSSSLMKHISAGALTSVTNLASSVSRNMDRLSLDDTHRERNEELRRQPPIGLAAGIGQGLTSLGFGVLGAVAGLVHHPLHNIQVAVAQSRSAGSVAQGIVSGVGKGLIGVVAKPIGGAAEFVSQTGQGLLYGVGWNMKLKQLHEPSMDYIQFQPNSNLKYACKMLPGCPASSDVFAVDATWVTRTGAYVPTVLLLTSELLFVVNSDDDGEHNAYSVAEWDCDRTADPTLLRFVPHSKDFFQGFQGEDCNRDRISEFIMKSCNYTLEEDAEHLVMSVSNSFGDKRDSSEMLFYTSPRLQTVFLALYNAAQGKVFKRGFCV